jgi:hypothetical protein
MLAFLDSDAGKPERTQCPNDLGNCRQPIFSDFAAGTEVRFCPIGRPELCRLDSTRTIRHDRAISPSLPVPIAAEDKLKLLRQLDRWRPWTSLDDRRLCLGCGRLITGHEVDATAGQNGEVDSVHCPTRGCESIPLDWILPNRRDRELQV